jgi:hypothetical protein
MYIGPFEENACKRAAIELLQQAQCKQADYLYACAVDGRPGSSTICPHFTYPKVKIK